jgi:enterochelin esterase-like enzyme
MSVVAVRVGLGSALLGLVLLLALPPFGLGATPSPGLLPASFSLIQRGPDGGSIWQGRIPNAAVPQARRPTLIYLPPGLSVANRYPVVYLLQGFPGSPYQYVSGLGLASLADELVARNELPPFIAVVPPAGVTTRFDGEWTGVWEQYLVRDVIPWVDAHLPTRAQADGRAVAGLSAGGYGAVDIGLRHPGLFGALESWSGYFTAPGDGSLANASPSVQAAHDPSLLVRREAKLLRSLGTRFFLSSGTTHDRAGARAAQVFASELATLGLAHRLWLAPGAHDGKLWRTQFPAALRYALTG